MKKSSRILVIKDQRQAAYARSWVLDDFGLHARAISDPAMLGACLSGEPFDVVVLDQRGSDEDLIESLEGLRAHQPHAKLIVVVGEGIGLQEIKQAMRFNVHDIFPPPFDLGAVMQRVESEVAASRGARPAPEGEVLARWSELAALLEGTFTGAALADAPTEGKSAADEVKDLRRQLDEAFMTSNRLAEEVKRLAGVERALRVAEARVHQLEANLDARPNIAPATSVDAAQQQRIAKLESELAEANQRLEMAGQAFAAEHARLSRCEIEARALAAAAEKREHDALSRLKERGAAASAGGGAPGDAGAGALARERAELQAQRDAVAVQEQALRELATILDQREAALQERASQAADLCRHIDADTAQWIERVSEASAQLQALAARRRELGERIEHLRSLAGAEPTATEA